MELSEVFDYYGHPDPSIVSILDKNGVQLSYVGHAEITKALSEVDAKWSWEPVLGADGLPAIRTQHGKIMRRDKDPLLVEMSTMWGKLTLNGVTRWAVGSVESHKPDLDKELVSDFLRNAAMRFGIALGLWMKDTAPTKPRMTTITAPGSDVVTERPANAPSDKQLWLVKKLLKDVGKLPPHNLGSLDKYEVSRLIEGLKGGEDIPPPSDNDAPKEPF